MTDFDRMAGRYRQIQRATVARSALDVIAIVFLCCGFAFWSVAFWQLLSPPALLSLLSIQVVVLALVFSLAAPLLFSMLVPTTPAGQMLQKTQWATVGFWVVFGCAGFLTYHCYGLISAWLSAQGGIEKTTGLPMLAATGQVMPLSIALTIAFVIIPALAWVQLTPERWLAQVNQAHQVKKLEMQQRGELAIIKASLVRAERLALKGWANLLPLEREEIFHMIRGLLQGTSDTQREIVRTLSLGADLEREIMDDETIGKQLDYVAQRLDVLPDVGRVPAAESATALAPQRTPDASERANHAPAPYTEPHQPRDAGRVAVRQDNAERDEAYTLAYDQLSGGAWTVRELAELLDVAESTARDIRIRWTAAGLVSGRGLPNGRYSFTEREVR